LDICFLHLQIISFVKPPSDKKVVKKRSEKLNFLFGEGEQGFLMVSYSFDIPQKRLETNGLREEEEEEMVLR
jgi:hypothetical protein